MLRVGRFKITIKRIILALVILFLITGAVMFVRSPLFSYDSNYSYPTRGVGKSVAFIIPGAGEAESKFKTIENYYKEAGITPVFIHMDWRIWHMKDFIKNGSEEIAKAAALYKGRNFYFFGFSFGAVVALSNAGKYQSKGTLLCSLSPLYKRDMTFAPSFMRFALQVLKIPLPAYVDIPEKNALFLYGDHDNRMIANKSLEAMRKSIYSKSVFEVVKGAKHDITGKAYLDKIKQGINRLKEADVK